MIKDILIVSLLIIGLILGYSIEDNTETNSQAYQIIIGE
jgi:hypothetical protein